MTKDRVLFVRTQDAQLMADIRNMAQSHGRDLTHEVIHVLKEAVEEWKTQKRLWATKKAEVIFQK